VYERERVQFLLSTRKEYRIVTGERVKSKAPSTENAGHPPFYTSALTPHPHDTATYIGARREVLSDPSASKPVAESGDMHFTT
jgi:hypothetical protein